MSLKSEKPHNLDINNYTLEEMFGLFDLTYDLTEKSMRAAKMKVLSLPQKSALAFQHFTLQLVDSISQIVASFTCSNYLPAIY